MFNKECACFVKEQMSLRGIWCNNVQTGEGHNTFCPKNVVDRHNAALDWFDEGKRREKDIEEATPEEEEGGKC